MAGAGDIMLGALQRRDGSIETVLCHSSQCILYNFNTLETKWVKTEIEGHLFVFKRCKSPHIGFTLMNTKNQENLTEILTPGIGLQLNCPCLLYKNSKGIYALWFQEKSDAERIFNVLKIYHPIGSEPSSQNLSPTSVAPKTELKKTSNSKSGSPSFTKPRSSHDEDSSLVSKSGAKITDGSSSILSMLYAADSKSKCKPSNHPIHKSASVGKSITDADFCPKKNSKQTPQDQAVSPPCNSSNISAGSGYLKTSATSAFGPPVPSYLRSRSESANPESYSLGIFAASNTNGSTANGKTARAHQRKHSESNHTSASKGSKSSSPWGQIQGFKSEKALSSSNNEEMPLLLQQMFSQSEAKAGSGSNNQKQPAQQVLLYPQLGHSLSTSVPATSAGLDVTQDQSALSSSPNKIDGDGGVSSRVQQLFSVDSSMASAEPSQPPLLTPIKCDKAGPKSSYVAQGASTQTFSPARNQGMNSTQNHLIHLAPQSFSPHPSSESFLKAATVPSNSEVLSQHDRKPFEGNPKEATSCFSISEDERRNRADFSKLSSGSNVPRNDNVNKDGDQTKSSNHDFILSEKTLQALHLMPPSQFLSDEDDCSSSVGSPPSRASFSGYNGIDLVNTAATCSSLDLEQNARSSNASVFNPNSVDPSRQNLQPRNPKTASLETMARKTNAGVVNLAMSMPAVFNDGSQNPSELDVNGSMSLFTDSEISTRPSSESRNELTVDQMQQAMIYLLQTDSSFVQKLHEAYLQSLQQPKKQGLVNGWHDTEK